MGSSKGIIWIGMFLGSIVGAYIPALWGDTDIFSVPSMLLGTIGAIAGIYVGFKISRY